MAAGIALIIPTALLMAWSLSIYSASATDVGRTYEFLSHARSLIATLERMETSQRGFLMTGAKSYLDPYYLAHVKVGSEIQVLRDFAGNDLSLLTQLQKVAVLSEEKISEMDHTIVLRRERGEGAARAEVLAGRGGRSITELRKILDQVEADASSRLTTRIAMQRRYFRWIVIAAISGSIVALTFLFLASQQKRKAERILLAGDQMRREHEGEFRLLADSIGQLAWMANADGWIFWFNRRWYDFTGATPEQMEGWGWQSVHDPAVLPAVLRAWKAALESGQGLEMEFPLMGADGNYHPFLTRAMPLKNSDEHIFRWFGTCTDITEIMRSQAAAIQLAAIVESTSDAIVSKAPDGTITGWNAAAERLFGYTAAEVMGRNVSILIPADRMAQEADILASVIAGQPLVDFETVRVRRNGEQFSVSATISPLRSSAGVILGTSKVLRDITTRKQTEAALIEIRKERESLIDRLELALSAKTVLLKEIHHRVKNNLAVVAGLLSMQADAIEPGRACQALLESQQRVMSMALIHESLYSTEQLDRVNFREYVEQLATELCNSYVLEPELVKVEILAEEIDLPVDKAVPCGLILNELLANALKYAFPNHRAGKITVRVQLLVTGEITITCADDGIGIPKDLDWENPKSLGLRIVTILTKQIEGELTMRRGASGTKFELKIPFGVKKSLPPVAVAQELAAT